MKNKLLLFVIGICLVALAACDSAGQSELPTPTPAPAYTRIKDVDYKAGQKMDIYAPAQPGNYPVVIGFHGGNVPRSSFNELAIELAKNGVVTFAAGWHSTPPPADSFLRGWEDAACAVRWVREYAAEYGGDPSRIIIVGHSAGGAVGAAVTLGGDDFHNNCLVDETGSALADGFVGLDGAYYILDHVPEGTKSQVPDEIEELIDPFYQVSAQPVRTDVKFILFVGDVYAGGEEELITYAHDFNDALQSAGYTSEVIQLEDVGHGTILYAPQEEIVNAIVDLAYDQ